MEFSTVFFVEIFLPVSAVLYYLLFSLSGKKNSVQNLFLLAISFLFYCFGGISGLLYLLFSIVFNFVIGILVGSKNKFSKFRKAIFVVSVLVNLAFLLVYKYSGMISEWIGIVFSKDIWRGILYAEGSSDFSLVAPLAISFITFKSLSYIIDIYLGKYKYEKSLAKYALFVAFFPAMLQGPIISYDDFRPFINSRTHSLDKVLYGLKRFSYGLGKKVIIANTLGETADKIFGADNVNSLGTFVVWLGVIMYTLQIYYDFSGYSDMAIGIASIFGFEVKENFDLPYTSLSVKEFWNRWHISLGVWFKKYIYIPLGGNKKGKGRQLLNLMVVFLVTGFWHGSNLTFILWGIYFGVLRVIEALFLGKLLDKNPLKFINWLYTMLAVTVGWVMFRAENLATAFAFLSQMFGYKDPGLNVYVTNYLNITVILMIIGGILLAGPVQGLCKKIKAKHPNSEALQYAEFIFQIIVLAVSIVFIVSGSYSPSIYARF